MSEQSLWSRIKSGRLFQVLVIYLAASWVILQVVVVLRDSLRLPHWIAPVAIILLVIGLVIMLATAWVQSHPLMPQREAADEVPRDWEFDVSEIKASVSRGRIPHLNWARALMGGAVAFLLLFGFAGLYVVIQDRGESFSPQEAMAEGAAPGIAVTPFDVSGAELEEWREGMVTLLSTGLDGAGDLRAIDSRTVLAQWDRRVPEGARADREMALEVARTTGARYAVLGSAVAIGSQLRLVADVYAVDEGSRLGTAQAEGSPDRVLDLVDDLVRETLALILKEGEGEIPPVDLAALTTSSLEALKPFLEGESRYRRGELQLAIEAYESAVEADSSFALAWNRLASAYGWLEGGSGRVGQFRERAMRHRDRLPEREQLLIEAEHMFGTGRVEGAELMREATRTYPDDAEARYVLGEFYRHHPQTLASFDDAEEAFHEAVELDPSFAPYRFHLTELAFQDSPDSALAAERVGELSDLNPNGLYARSGRLALGLAFGDPDRRAALMDSIAGLDVETLEHILQYLFHPRFWELEKGVRELLVQKENPLPLGLFDGDVFKRGHLAQGLEYIDMPGGPPWFPVCALLGAHAFGIPIPDEVLEAHLALRAADSMPGPRTACGGFYALDQGRRDDHRRALSIHRRAVDEALAEGDSAAARVQTALVRALEGYARWKDGDASGALPLLQDAYREVGPDSWALWIGQIYLELGQPGEAIPYFRAIRFNPLADYYEGLAYEQAGEFEKAREAYGSLAVHWRGADPELQPMVEEARQGIIRLRGLQRR